MSDNKLVILRGISGAGKSTFAKKLGGSVYSADDFFLNHRGEYVFERERLSRVHELCRINVRAAMIREEPLIIVDNTNTRLWEMKPYLQMAEVFDYKVAVIRLIIEPSIAYMRNVHDISYEQITAQALRFESYDGEHVLGWNKSLGTWVAQTYGWPIPWLKTPFVLDELPATTPLHDAGCGFRLELDSRGGWGCPKCGWPAEPLKAEGGNE